MKRTIVVILIMLGVAVRFMQYASDRPLWVDEAMLTSNILHRSIPDLLKPLDYEQQAPIGFLLVEKWLTMTFGIEEVVLRLLPFVASIGSLILMSMLAQRVLPYSFAVLSILLFVFSAPLIYYASEVKPYALDLTVGLLLTLLAIQKSSPLLLFLIGFIGLWFSQAIVFVLAAIGLVSMIESMQKKDWSKWYLWLGISFGWIVSFILQSHISLGQYYARYRDAWVGMYAPFPPTTMADFSWYAHTFIESIRSPGGISLWPIGLVTFLVGARYYARAQRRVFFLLLMPGFLALVASVLHFYPFHGRFLLFFAPAILLCISAGFWRMFAWAWKRPWITVKLASVVMLCLLVGNAITIGVYRLQNPQRFEVITPLIRSYLEKKQEGDTLYLYYGAAFAFDYYAQRFHIEPTYINGVERTSDLKKYQQDLKKLDGKSRVWVLFSHIYNWAGIDEEAYFVRQLDGMGKRTDEMHTDGASLYLYDLSDE